MGFYTGFRQVLDRFYMGFSAGFYIRAFMGFSKGFI